MAILLLKFLGSLQAQHPVAIEKVKDKGTMIPNTTSHQPSCVDMSHIAVNEICILGSRCGDLSLALSYFPRTTCAC